MGRAAEARLPFLFSQSAHLDGRITRSGAGLWLRMPWAGWGGDAGAPAGGVGAAGTLTSRGHLYGQQTTNTDEPHNQVAAPTAPSSYRWVPKRAGTRPNPRRRTRVPGREARTAPRNSASAWRPPLLRRFPPSPQCTTQSLHPYRSPRLSRFRPVPSLTALAMVACRPARRPPLRSPAVPTLGSRGHIGHRRPSRRLDTGLGTYTSSSEPAT